MADLTTHYMGLKLKNPIIVGACNLSDHNDLLQEAEQAGAAAIVYRSLFEEQIQLEKIQLQDDLELYNERNAEMIKLFPDIHHAGPEEHLVKLRQARKKLRIPLIASLNAIYKESWIEYARLLEETGIDALELNFYSVPQSPEKDGSTIEEEQIRLLEKIKKAVKIPVSVKLSPFYSNTLHVVSRMDQAGVNGFVLFNRMFQPDIDQRKEQHTILWNLSVPADNRLPLRFVGLLYKQIQGDICSSTGIFTGIDVIKMILAGASCVQVVSTLYINRIHHITTMITEVEEWMKSKQYGSLNDFRGKLSMKSLNDPFIYKRAQYVDLLMKSEEIFTRYPMR